MKKHLDKVAVITGGTSGIGFATAKMLIEEGAKVVVFARGKKGLAATALELGPNCFAIEGDVTNLADLENLFLTTASRLGKIDILVVNAAQAKLAAIADTTEEFFNEMVNINFKGGYFTIQKSIPYLNDRASVVVVTSWLNSIGFGGSSLLSASKAALRSIVRVAAAELIPRGIRVNAISPGAIGTPLWGKIGLPEEVLKAAGQEITNQIPLKRWGQPEEIARTILFLAHEDSSYIVGSELMVDGGLRQI